MAFESRSGRWASAMLVLAVLALVRGAAYGTLVPPWQAPDEPQHYQAVRLALELGPVPGAPDDRVASRLASEVYRSLRENRFWELRRRPSPVLRDARTALEALRSGNMAAADSHPPVYYVLGAAWLMPFRSSGIVTQMYALRLLSVLLGVIPALVVYRLAGWLSPGDQYRCLAAGLFVVLLPMRTYMSAAVNNDGLVEMWAALTFFLLFRVGWRGLAAGRVAAVFLALCLALLTKRTSLFLIPVTLCGLLSCPGAFDWATVRFPRFRVHWGLWMLLSVAAGCGLLLVLVGCAGWLGLGWWGASDRVFQFAERLPTRGLDQYILHSLLGFASFWANFGWMNVPLGIGWYVALAFVSLAAGLGWLRVLRRSWNEGNAEPAVRWMWAMCGLSLLFLAAQACFSMIARDRPPQGRYLFPGMVPIALCFTWGIFEWFGVGHRKPVFWGLVTWWVLFDAAALLGYMLPYFYAGRT